MKSSLRSDFGSGRIGVISKRSSLTSKAPVSPYIVAGVPSCGIYSIKTASGSEDYACSCSFFSVIIISRHPKRWTSQVDQHGQSQYRSVQFASSPASVGIVLLRKLEIGYLPWSVSYVLERISQGESSGADLTYISSITRTCFTVRVE